MFETRKTQIFCPYCREEHSKEIKLYEFIDDDKTIGYICKDGCVSVFDASYITDYDRGIILYIAKRRDPNYGRKLDGGWLDNYIENEKRGGKLHSNSYIIKTFIDKQ